MQGMKTPKLYQRYQRELFLTDDYKKPGKVIAHSSSCAKRYS